jgi:hypothetical protein
MLYSELWPRVVWLKLTDVSEECTASSSACGLLLAGCSLLLLFDPEDGISTLLQNVGELLSDYVASYPRGQYSAINFMFCLWIVSAAVWFIIATGDPGDRKIVCGFECWTTSRLQVKGNVTRSVLSTIGLRYVEIVLHLYRNCPQECRIWGSRCGGYEEFYFLLKVRKLAACFLLVSCLAYSSTLRRVPPECRLTSNGLHSFISQRRYNSFVHMSICKPAHRNYLKALQ